MSTVGAGREFVKLLADFPSTDVEGVGSGVVTGFAFTPEVSQRYYVEGVLLLRSSNTATGPRAGIQWPTAGVSDEVCNLYGLGAGNGVPVHHCEGELLTTNRTCLLLGVESASFSYPVILRAWFETGAGPITGDFQILLFTETGVNSVTMRAGSFLAVYSGHTDQ